MRRPRHAERAAHASVSIPEFATLLGFTSPKAARRWLTKHKELGVRPSDPLVPRTVLELARALLTGDSGYHASAKLEAYLKEHHDQSRTGRPERPGHPGA